MEKTDAIAIIQGRVLIAEPGQFQLRVTSAVAHMREDVPVTILNFNAMTPYHLEKAKEELKADNYQEATNFALSTNARVGKDFTPAKGQIVNVVVDTYTNKDGIQALGVVSVSPLETKRAAAIDLSSFEDELEGDDDNTDLTADKTVADDAVVI